MNQLTSLEPLVDETRRGQIVRRLRELIVKGSVEPGQKLTETQLAEKLGVSRAPLREAIRELVESGLVESIPYKGLFVRNVTRRDLEELYSLRTALEQFAFRECWENRTETAKQDLIRRHDALIEEIANGKDPQRAIELELVLHSWCYELSGHKLLLKSWEQMKPNLQFYFILHQKAHNRCGPLREAHDIYVKSAIGDDLDAMLGHLHDHMRQGLQRTLKDVDFE
ncbi:MAG: GntR family transcriptional regulator [Rhizobiaceae bacterium]|nr:GntR family transcriptional regulator [Rhizobiaceae bacterium]